MPPDQACLIEHSWRQGPPHLHFSSQTSPFPCGVKAWTQGSSGLGSNWLLLQSFIMEAEICPNCEKVVYDAEGFPAGNVILMPKIGFY